MAVAVALDQRSERLRFVERREIFALRVLDQRDRERAAPLADHGRQAVEARQLRRPQATLTGQELVPGAAPPDHDRLQEATLEDGRGELDDLVFREVLAW